MREPLRQRWQRWLDRRIPPSSSVTLDQRRIFIFPSATGFFFFLCLLVMLLAAINYQNNIVKNTKYNIITFIPLVLYNQFKFFFNMFFLVTALSQLI